MENWEKELRHKHKYEDLIINRPEAMTNLRQKTEISITTIGWIIWIFVCRPIFIVLLWAIGFRFFFEHMIDLGGLAGLKQMWVLYATIIFTVYIIVRGWNVYNKLVYGKKNRRRKMPPTTDMNLEDFFKLPASSVSQIRKMNEVIIDFEEDHKIRIANDPKGSLEGRFRPT